MDFSKQHVYSRELQIYQYFFFLKATFTDWWTSVWKTSKQDLKIITAYKLNKLHKKTHRETNEILNLYTCILERLYYLCCPTPLGQHQRIISNLDARILKRSSEKRYENDRKDWKACFTLSTPKNNLDSFSERRLRGKLIQTENKGLFKSSCNHAASD